MMVNAHDKDKEKRDQARRRNGSVAWQRLTDKSEPKLKVHQRVVIARNLYEEIRTKNINPRDLAREAKFTDPYRTLFRLQLPDGADPKKRGLYAGKENIYVQSRQSEN